ncbi:unnamed protein product [Ascophyllum nodosum]
MMRTLLQKKKKESLVEEEGRRRLLAQGARPFDKARPLSCDAAIEQARPQESWSVSCFSNAVAGRFLQILPI